MDNNSIEILEKHLVEIEKVLRRRQKTQVVVHTTPLVVFYTFKDTFGMDRDKMIRIRRNRGGAVDMDITVGDGLDL